MLMPTIPTSEVLGQRVFQDRSQVVRPQLDFSGQQRLVDTAQQVASNVNDRLDRASMQKAKIEFQRAKLDADAAFDQDPDFSTHETRYNELLGKAVESSSKLVRNPRMAEAFKEEIGLYQAEGAANIKKKAFAKEIKYGIADLDGKLTTARENYLRATDPKDREFSLNGIMESIDFAEESGYIDKVQSQSMREKAAVDLAIASIKIEPASKQVQLLKENQGLIDVIPKDIRLKMIEQAEGASQTDVALTIAGQIRSRGGDLSERFAEADKIKDVKVREMVKSQVEQDVGREKRAVAQKQYDAYDSLKKNVIAGKTSLEVSKENPDAWNSMSGDQQQAIRSMDSNKRETSDLNVYNTINQMARENKDKAYQHWLENADKLSSSDNKQISDRFAKPEELDGFLERTGRLEVALRRIDVTDKKSDSFNMAREQLDKDYMSFEKTKGRKPDAEELDKLIIGITDKVVEGGWGNPFTQGHLYVSPVRGFEVPQEQRAARAKIISFDQKITTLEAKLSASSGKPVSVSDAEKNELYKKWDSKGILND